METPLDRPMFARHAHVQTLMHAHCSSTHRPMQPMHTYTHTHHTHTQTQRRRRRRTDTDTDARTVAQRAHNIRWYHIPYSAYIHI